MNHPIIGYTDRPGDIPEHFFQSMADSVFDGKKNVYKSRNRMHAFKRHAIQTWSENLAPHVFCGRGGWPVRSTHSLFKYCIGTEEQDDDAGRVAADWTSKVGGDIQGGVPPSMSAITTSILKVDVFVRALFRR